MKRLYHMLSLLALTHLFALAGLLGYLFASGRLNEERINQLATVLRGEYPKPPPVIESVEPEAAFAVASVEEIAQTQEATEFRALLEARSRSEQADRLALHEAVALETMRNEQKLTEREKRFAAEKNAFLEETSQKGFDKVLETMSTIEPAQAINLLMKGGTFQDADTVRLLMAMDPNRVKKIVNECKSPEELAWIGRIQAQLFARNNESANGVDGPDVASSGG